MSISIVTKKHPIDAEWVHIKFSEKSIFKDVYGFSGNQGMVNLEGIRYIPKGKASATLLIYMHPASTLQLLPMPRAMAEVGVHVLCAGSRYARNDTALIMENVVIDLGAYVEHAKNVWGYKKVVLVGWSGGGSLALLYQSQAEHPAITHTPAGDPCSLIEAKLIPADGFILQAAHISRAEILADWIDPSVRDENDPDDRDPELDLYDRRNSPPYSAEFLIRYRDAQRARIRRRTAWAIELLEQLRRKGGYEMERCFVTHRTMADPRFLSAIIDPNDRVPGMCYMGHPETVNASPAGLARFSTLRSWLSQWSIDDTQADGERCARHISVPFLAIENSADDAVPKTHMQRLFETVASADKTMRVIPKANHYYVGQPELLYAAVNLCIDWMTERQLLT